MSMMMMMTRLLEAPWCRRFTLSPPGESFRRVAFVFVSSFGQLERTISRPHLVTKKKLQEKRLAPSLKAEVSSLHMNGGIANVNRTSLRHCATTYTAAGNAQTVHHRPQMPTRSSSTIPVRTVYCIPVSTSAGRHFLRSATCGDLLVPINVNIRTSQFRRLRTQCLE